MHNNGIISLLALNENASNKIMRLRAEPSEGFSLQEISFLH